MQTARVTSSTPSPSSGATLRRQPSHRTSSSSAPIYGLAAVPFHACTMTTWISEEGAPAFRILVPARICWCLPVHTHSLDPAACRWQHRGHATNTVRCGSGCPRASVFAQVVGRKRFVLSPPHEGSAYVGKRLRKAARVYVPPEQTRPGGFSRTGGGVMHETVINYLNTPARPTTMPTVTVTLEPGDLLYLPFGWWHEVHSEPDAESAMSASVSHFFTPYYCRLGGKRTTGLGPLLVHPRYRADAELRALIDEAHCQERVCQRAAG
jgi:hypothetical protein